MASENKNDSDLQFFEVRKINNEAFSAVPPILKFCYSVTSSKELKELKLTNISGVLQRLFILPPLTKYFRIIHPEKGWIAPGLGTSIKVLFEANPSEKMRHYKDCIRVLCDLGESSIKKDFFLHQNMPLLDKSMLSIPIIAEPHNPHCNVPREINFDCVQMGQKAVSSFKISPQPGQKIVFFIVVPESNTNFSIDPLHGVLNENDPPAVINVTFTPSEYKIIKLPIQVCIPSSSMTPYSVLLTAMCKPWQISQGTAIISKSQQLTNNKKLQDKKQQFAIHHHKSTKQIDSDYSTWLTPLKKDQHNKTKPSEIPLNTIHGVAKFLSQKPKREKDPFLDLLGPFGKYQEEEKAIVNELENKFIFMVKKEMERLHHISFSNEVALGNSPDTPNVEELAEIEIERFESQQHYQDSQKIIQQEILYTSDTVLQLQRRVLRNYNEIFEPRFTSTPNDMFFLRNQILSKFIQTARKVIIQNRLIRRLAIIKASLKQETFI